MNYIELIAMKNHLAAKLGFWMNQGRNDKASQCRKELAKVEKKIAKELEGDLILN